MRSRCSAPSPTSSLDTDVRSHLGRALPANVDMAKGKVARKRPAGALRSSFVRRDRLGEVKTPAQAGAPRFPRYGGSQRYHTASKAHLGPASLAAFASWPKAVIEALTQGCDGDSLASICRKRRLQNAVGSGIILHTDFSGKQCVETAVRMLGQELETQCLVNRGTVPCEWVICWRASDIDRLCVKILKDAGISEHVFGDVAERLPHDMQARLASMMPPATASDDAKAAAHTDIRAWLLQSSHRLARDLRAPCAKHHGHECPIGWLDPAGARPSERPLTMNCSGPVCLPWCSLGTRAGEAHDSMVSFAVWQAEMMACSYDVVLLENSRHFPLALFSEPLRHKNHIVSITLGPDQLGWPARRTRLFAVALNRESLAWCGEMSDSAVATHFFKCFGKRVAVDANIFARADSMENIVATRAAVGSRAGVRAEAALKTPLADLFKGSARARAAEYIKRVSKHVGFVSGTAAADLSQNPFARARIGPWLPTVTRNMLAVNLGKDDIFGHIYTPREIAFSQGWPSLPMSENEGYRQVVSFDLHELSPRAQQLLQGNAMHLPTLASWLAYVLAHTLRRDVVREFLPDLRLLSVGNSAQNDGVDGGAPTDESSDESDCFVTSVVRPRDQLQNFHFAEE